MQLARTAQYAGRSPHDVSCRCACSAPTDDTHMSRLRSGTSVGAKQPAGTGNVLAGRRCWRGVLTQSAGGSYDSSFEGTEQVMAARWSSRRALQVSSLPAWLVPDDANTRLR